MKFFKNWARAWQNQQNDVHPAKTDISLASSQSSLSAWRFWSLANLHSQVYGSSATQKVHRKDWSECPGWSVFTGTQVLLLVLSCYGSFGPGHAKTCLMSYANNKGADRPAHPRSLISTFVVRCLVSMICIFATSKISRFYLDSVAEQAGLNLIWSKITEDMFSHDVTQLISAENQVDCNDPKNLDRQVWANSVHPHQTAHWTDRSGQTVYAHIRLLIGQTDLGKQCTPTSDCSLDRQVWANSVDPHQTAHWTDRSGQTVYAHIRLLIGPTDLGKQCTPTTDCSLDRQVWANSVHPHQTAHWTDRSGQTVYTHIRLRIGQTGLGKQCTPTSDCSLDRQVWANSVHPHQTAHHHYVCAW